MQTVKAEQPDNAAILARYRPRLTSDVEFAAGALGETGAEGISAFYGHVSETYINKLNWPGAYQVYNEMRRRDPTLRSLLNAVKLLARQATWSAEGASDKPKDREAAEFVQSNLEDMSHTVEDFIDDALSCLWAGWSSFELCYKRREGTAGANKSMFDDGRIGWRKFAFRRQSTFQRWNFDERGGFGGWYQSTPPTYREVLLPAEKLLHFVGERDGNNPEGISLFESAYEPWHYVVNLQIVSGIGWQRTFVGLPVFEFSEKPDAADKAIAKALGEGLTVDDKQYVSVPPGVKFSLVSTANSGAGALLETIKMYRAMMLQIALLEFLMQAQLGTGSYSAQADKSDIFMIAVNGYLDKIAAVWNRFGVARLFEFEANRFEGIAGLPVITHSEVRKPNRTELGAFISQIAQYIHLGDEDELWIRRQSGMPETIPEEPPDDTQPPQPDDTTPGPPDDMKPETGEGTPDTQAKALGAGASNAELAEFDGRDSDIEGLTGEYQQLLNRFFRDQARRVKEAAQVGGNLADNDVFWQNEEKLLTAAMLPALTDYLNRLVGFTVDDTETIFRIGVDYGMVNEGALSWAREFAGQEVRNVTDATRRAVRQAVASNIEAGGSLDDLVRSLEPTFGVRRAKNIAVTEITSAYAEGNIKTWMASGMATQEPEKRPIRDSHIGCYCWLSIEPRDGKWVWVWKTRFAKDVCPICVGLHDQVVGVARETLAG